MKRLVFCFDGTWNRLDAPCPTNVVLTAESVIPRAKDGTVQIVYYDQGVGTAEGTKWSGGIFGEGLLDNIVNAYSFLVFNYEVGDEIYIFGFSRGAFTARSFAGFLRTVGILPRSEAGHIAQSVEAYKHRGIDEDPDSERFLTYRSKASPQICCDLKEDAWRQKNIASYQGGSSPVMRIRYLGVWDTVGELGVPEDLLIAPLVNKQYMFHDTSLSSMVVAARHAVSIDEPRKSFAPTLWNNTGFLNAQLGFADHDAKAPYQQMWFPGVHGSVGGGGDIRGLSDFALDWVVSGARDVGLELDTTKSSRIFSLNPDLLAPLSNVSNPPGGLAELAMHLLPTGPRLPGPADRHEVSESAVKRWVTPAASLPEKAVYRPKTLDRVAVVLNQAAAVASEPRIVPAGAPAAVPTPGGYYRVVLGDTLSAISQKAYGKTSEISLIFAANGGVLTSPDRVYPGQVLFIPPISGDR
jgi:uncharacterized protein (DUF2235 family)/phage tail protein X